MLYPTPETISLSIARKVEQTHLEVEQLEQRLEILRQASKCHHKDIGSESVGSYDGHRMDYETVYYCKGCGWGMGSLWR